MALVCFSANGYDYFDTDEIVLFSGDKTHRYLFDYVSVDLTKLQKLLEQYISKRMNIETFDLLDDEHDDSDGVEMKEVLMSLHPYYEHEYRDVIIKAIGDYLNHTLLYASYKEKKYNFRYDEEWYLKRFTALAEPFLWKNAKYSKEYYNKYEKWDSFCSYSPYEERFCADPQTQPAQAFYDEHRKQEAIFRMLFWILDVSVPSIESLTIPQRASLFGYKYKSTHDLFNLKMITRISLNPPSLFRGNKDYYEETEDYTKMVESSIPLSKHERDCVENEDYSPEILNTLRATVEYAKRNFSEGGVYKEYEINFLHQLLYLEVLSMIQSGTNIKRCNRCKKYFVITNRKIAYCDRVFEGKVCSMVGSKSSFQKKMKEEPELRIYSRAYKTHHARHRNGIMNQNEFFTWCEEARKKLDAVRAGELDIVTFEAWLKL